ncbi:MAG: polysaccharide biosynthesis protein [Candidatus Acidiferrales bacterium]
MDSSPKLKRRFIERRSAARSVNILPAPPASARTGLGARAILGTVRYGPGFLAQVGVFYLALVVGEIVATGRTGTRDHLAFGFVIAFGAMGLAEATFRLYKRVWAVAGLSDAIALALAVIEACSLVTLAEALIPGQWRPFPIVIPVLVAPIVLSVLGGTRLLPRLWLRRSIAENRLLVVVPDSSAYWTVRSLVQHSSALWSPIAIVTVKKLDARMTVMGIPVVGDTSELGHWIQVTHADGVAFVPGDMAQADFRSLLSVCLREEKPIFIVPAAEEWLRSVGSNRIRMLTADDLVARSTDELDLHGAVDSVGDRTVLVTGAAGSIGSELCRILVTLKPRRLVLVDNNESGLFDIAAQLRGLANIDLREALVSVTDRETLLTLFTDERPDIVFHAAAYKHVPMLESHPEQAVSVNVIGTCNVVACSQAVSAGQLVLISTDKAASTQSVMGCTKRLCELVVLSHEGTMHCRAVRFGNVIGSRGSVAPIFERQIQQGGPITITDPGMTRYMMTARQAASLVISTLGLPGRHLYMLDMGEPVKILDLANALIRSRGLRPGKDIEIIFTGARRGERLAEDLLGPGEGWRSTSNTLIREVVTPIPTSSVDLEWTINHLWELAKEQRSSELVRALKQSVWTRSPADVQEAYAEQASPTAMEYQAPS